MVNIPDVLDQRLSLCRAAIEAALLDHARIRQDMAEGRPAWWSELAPLTSEERPLVVEEVRKILLPDRPA